ncbi:MAG TPA: DinB family protein [Bacillota bacterium]|jgi:uncharacterized damage-inducible protein DinB
MDSKILLHRWEQSRAAFRKLAEGIPPGKEGFRPTPETMSLVELVLHVASAEKTAVDALTVMPGQWKWETGLDAKHYPTIDQALDALDRQSGETRKYLAALSDDDVASRVRTPWAETTIEDLFYDWIIHEVHHRGNLITTLRLAGVKPASVYV